MIDNFFESNFALKSKFHWDFHRDIQNKILWYKYAELFKKYEFKSKDSDLKNSKIPKIIHQIWLGPKNKPEYFELFKNSWIKKNPDYKYIFWNEKNINNLSLINHEIFDKSYNPGLKSDILRYEILNLFGGIYVDTDFECIEKVPDELLNLDFVACMQFEKYPQIGNSFLMSKKGSVQIRNIIKRCKKPLNESGQEIMECTGPHMLSATIESLIDENINMVILPSNYCFPIPNFLIRKGIDTEKLLTKESFAIHHWNCSWLPKRKKNNIIYRIISSIKKKFLRENG